MNAKNASEATVIVHPMVVNTQQKTLKEEIAHSGSSSSLSSSSSSSSAAVASVETQSSVQNEAQAATTFRQQETAFVVDSTGNVIKVQVPQDTNILHMGAQGPNNNNPRSGSSSSSSSSTLQGRDGVIAGAENTTVVGQKEVQWTNHGYKHVSPKNIPWKEIVKQTAERKQHAKYKPGINIEALERKAWSEGTLTEGRPWKVMKCDSIIGAKNGQETVYMRVEMTSNTIHGHPITFEEYKDLMGKSFKN